MSESRKEHLRLIATEEAFACKEYSVEVQKLIDRGVEDLDLYRMWFATEPPAPGTDGWAKWWKEVLPGEATPEVGTDDAFLGWWRTTRDRMYDLGPGRIKVMDEADIDVFVLSLISPGVQLFDADTATAMATTTNDAIAEAVKRHPDRFAGLASFAPQDPKRAAKEIERAISTLKLNGLIINSHTNGEYLDDPKFWPIFEAACAVDAPIYIHPRNPPRGPEILRMLTLHGGRRLTEVLWGYGMETGLHAARLLLGGVFEQFPKLKIVLGHMGECLPYYLPRINWALQNAPGPKPSDRFKENFYVTTSGSNRDPLWADVLRYCHATLGPDRILFAVDYPFADSNQAADFLRSAPLPKEDVEKIAFRNSEKIFRIASKKKA